MVREPQEFEAAFSAIAAERADAVIVQPTLPRKPAIDLLSSTGSRRFRATGRSLRAATDDICGKLNDRYREAAVYVDDLKDEAGGPSGTAADALRTRDQPEDRKGARHRNSTGAARRADEVIE